MRLSLTDDQVREMARRAILASEPVGLGFLHYRPGLKLEEINLKGLDRSDDTINPGIFVDYYEGRMVKFASWKQPDGTWKFHDETSHDYQSWKSTYDSYEVLAKEVAG